MREVAMPDESKKGEKSTIKEVPLKSWEEFEDTIKMNYQAHEDLKRNYPKISNILFRGQANKFWGLETTLERYVKDKKVTKREYSPEEYFNILEAIKPATYSLAKYNPEFKESPIDPLTGKPSKYEFIIYVRHHGFPSPLLDWTRSPYVAAYFAFNDSKDEDVAIYSFLERKDPFKSARSSTPQIEGIGYDVVTHKRHYQQQCEYTVCYIEFEGNPDNRIFTCHEKVKFSDKQDFLKKYIIPSTERKKVLGILADKGINNSALFGNENNGDESLMDTLAYREIENRL